MVEIVSKPNHGDIFVRDGKVTSIGQIFFDDLQTELNQNLLGNQVQLSSYTVATLPVATTAFGLIGVSDETGGATVAFSDGTNWRRVQDRVIIS